MTVKNQLSKKATEVTTGKQPNSIKEWIVAMKPQIEAALPSVITAERFTRMALTAVSSNPQLAQCTPASFMGAMMQAAQLGLEPNTPLGQAYLIPFRNKGQLEVQYQTGYKGLIELAHRSGEFKNIEARVVYENDDFQFEYGLEPKLYHKPVMVNRGEVIAYYAVYTLVNGGFGFEVMSIEDIKNHAKQYSKAYSSGYSPWKTSFDEMAKKGLHIMTPIPTIDGWTTMGEIEEGDIVFDMYGEPTEVIATSEVKHLKCYKITFSNGEEIICDDEHRWVASIGSNAARNVRKKGWETLTINELYEAKKNGKGVVVPVNPMLNTEKISLPIHPWMLGYWIGNGSRIAGNVSCDVKDVDYVCNKIKESGYGIGTIRKDKRSNSVAVGVLGLIADLKKYGFYGNKHIPQMYLRSDITDRKMLLQGLLDSDGNLSSNRRARASFATVRFDIAKTVLELVNSLGETAAMCKLHSRGFDTETDYYQIQWKPSFNPFGMPRKSVNYIPRKLNKYRSIKSIEEIESVPTRCIAVAADSKTYLAGESMIPTHNTVLKRVLKYAPIKTEFVRNLTVDETIKSEISDDMSLVADDTVIEAEYVIDEDTGEVIEEEQVTLGE